MSNPAGPKFGYCNVCLIRYEEGTSPHESKEDCIAALRLGLHRASERARTIGFAVSTRMIGILEELVHQPESGGVNYSIFRQENGQVEQRIIPAKEVSGIFAALLSKYEEMGDWSPYQAEKERADQMEASATRLMRGLLQIQSLLEVTGDPSLADIAHEVRSTLESLPQTEREVLQSFADQQETRRH